MSPYDKYRPDWAFWHRLPAVALWEAVALSLNVEPRVLLAHPFGGGSAGVAVSAIPPQGFYERLDLASRCIDGKTLPTAETLSPDELKVTLQAFTKWATDFGWDLPNELHALLNSGESGVEPALRQDGDLPMPTGAPGRPTKGTPIVKAEFDRRRAKDECKPTVSQEAAYLETWFREHYKVADPVKAQTIANNIRDDHRAWRESRRKPEH